MSEKVNIAELNEAAKRAIANLPNWKKYYDSAPENAKREFEIAFSNGLLAISRPDQIAEVGASTLKERSDRYRNMSFEDFEYIISALNGACKVGVGTAYSMMRGKPEGYLLGWWSKNDVSLFPDEEQKVLLALDENDRKKYIDDLVNQSNEKFHEEYSGFKGQK